MEWLNYHHLHYFWVVAQEGSVTLASRRLRLAASTISAQVRTLEIQLGSELFERRGRRMALTDAGQKVYRYAEQIFQLGERLTTDLTGASPHPAARLRVGVVDAVPKRVAYRLLEPALRLTPPPRLTCREGRAEVLVAELILGDLDLVLSDAPIAAAAPTYAHLLGESDIGFFAATALAEQFRAGFPRSLDGAPLLLPMANSAFRRALDDWLTENGIRPNVIAEFEDGALLSVFGEAGTGVFAAPTAIERRLPGLEMIGRIERIRERYFAITRDRRADQPAVTAIVRSAASALRQREGRPGKTSLIP
jgi:LysR family transcriptional activator of nhaA